jgi:sec-independent protein translocase protein TatA
LPIKNGFVIFIQNTFKENVIPSLGWPELLIVLAIFALIFGVGKLPQIGGAVGRSIGGFKAAVRGEDSEQGTEAS